VKAELQRKYPGAEIVEYDAKTAGEINLGEMILYEGGRQILSARRIYTDVVGDAVRVFPPK
jgi:hypothetical protein